MKLQEINEAALVWGPISVDGIAYVKTDKEKIIIPEHRPFMLGLKYNCPRLRKEGIDFVYCTDSTLGLLFYQGKIAKTLLFCREKKEDGVIAVAGALYVSMLSKMHGVGVYVLQQSQVPEGLLSGDASIFGGRNFIVHEDEKNYIVPPEDEFVSWDYLNK